MEKKMVHVEDSNIVDEEISENEYNKAIEKIDFSVPLQQNASNHEILIDDCATGACPIK